MNVLAAGLRAVPGRRWSGSIPDVPDSVWCRSGLGTDFSKFLASLVANMTDFEFHQQNDRDSFLAATRISRNSSTLTCS